MDRRSSPSPGAGQAVHTRRSSELAPLRLAGEPRSSGLAWALWLELKDTAWQELHHPLIRGLAHGTLSKCGPLLRPARLWSGFQDRP